METVTFDVMRNGKFIMQYHYRWFQTFPLNFDEVIKEIISKRPTLKGEHIELFVTKNLVR